MTAITFFTLKTADVDGDDEDDLAGSFDAKLLAGANIVPDSIRNDTDTADIVLGTWTVKVHLTTGAVLDDLTTDDRDAAKDRVGAVRTAMKAANGESTPPKPAARAAKKS